MKPFPAAAVAFVVMLASARTLAQDIARLVTQADVGKATGLRFKAPTYPMKTQAKDQAHARQFVLGVAKVVAPRVGT